MVLMLVALLAAGPAFAQKQSLADRVARLEQQSAAQAGSSGQANVELLNRLTQMQGEVQALRNQVEQLQNDNEQIKQRNREQYLDLDSRLQRIEGSAVAPAAKPAGAAAPPPPRPAATAPVPGPRASAPAADEQGAYAAAFDALKRGDYVESARGFQAYLRAYPQGSLAPNAWYWLGESYYVTQNFPIALQSIESLLSQFPDSAKVPGALLKVGYCQIEMGDERRGLDTLNRVVDDYPDSEAARTASSRLRALSVESR